MALDIAMRRRRFLAVGATALGAAALPSAAQKFQPVQDITPLIAKVTGGAPIEPGGIEVELPAIAENGNSVPLRIRVASPMTGADHVTAVHVFAERNPRPAVATFHFSPQSGRAEVTTRVRLAGTQRLTVIAALSGNRFRRREMDVLVTSAACLDEALAET
jgi:sulfur-oxidizing protein SoxY